MRIYEAGCDANRTKGMKLGNASEKTWWSAGECMWMERCVAVGCRRT